MAQCLQHATGEIDSSCRSGCDLQKINHSVHTYTDTHPHTDLIPRYIVGNLVTILYLHVYISLFPKRYAAQIEPHVRSRVPKAVTYFKRMERYPTVRSGKFRSGETLLTCTFYAEPDGMGKVEPIHRNVEKTHSQQLKQFVGGAN